MKKRKLLLFSALLLSLASCEIISFSELLSGSMPSSSSSNKIDSSLTNSITKSEFEGQNYYQASDLRYTFRDTNSQFGWYTSHSVGEQKMLIVPVELSNYAGTWTNSKLLEIENAFFGDASETTFESVKSYFYEASYGKLTLSGEVTDVLTSSYSYNQMYNMGESGPDYITDEFYSSVDASLVKEYDLDGDGYIDNCIFVYSNPYEVTSSSPFWAWCTYNYQNYPNTAKPTVNNYMWVSYEFINDTYYDNYNSSKLETHTYIHETGHLLGLDDYYCYDDASYAWDCAGQLDMQAYNVGDHNAYSKMALGWINPYVITGSAEITLKTSSKYPQAILINDNWNGSAFDEYILIEYYTPTGLNEVDANHPFNQSTKMYNYNGLRIYHVDARIVKSEIKTGSDGYAYLAESDNYVDTIGNESNYCYVVGASNSVDYSYLPSSTARKYRQLHLLDQGGNNRLNGGYGGNVVPSSALWTGTKAFTPNSTFFANGDKFNDGSVIGYSVSVSNLTDEECTVTITKL